MESNQVTFELLPVHYQRTNHRIPASLLNCSNAQNSLLNMCSDIQFLLIGWLQKRWNRGNRGQLLLQNSSHFSHGRKFGIKPDHLGSFGGQLEGVSQKSTFCLKIPLFWHKWVATLRELNGAPREGRPDFPLPLIPQCLWPPLESQRLDWLQAKGQKSLDLLSQLLPFVRLSPISLLHEILSTSEKLRDRKALKKR